MGPTLASRRQSAARWPSAAIARRSSSSARTPPSIRNCCGSSSPTATRLRTTGSTTGSSPSARRAGALPAVLGEAARRGLRSVRLSSLLLPVPDLDRLDGRAGRLLQRGDGEPLAREEEQAQTQSD